MPDPYLNADTKEGIGEQEEFYTIDTPDSDLVKMIDKKIASASKDFEEFKKEGKINENYWNRRQLEGIPNLRWYNSRIIQNRIYMGVETMVPIMNSKPAEPVISIADEDEDSEKVRDLTRQIEKMLLDKYYDDDFPQQEMFEMLSRHLLLYKLGLGKIVWYDEMDDFVVEFVHPHKVIFGMDGHYSQDIWIAQYLEKTLDEIIKEVPDKENDIMANLFPGLNVPQDMVGSTPIGFWEYWPEDGKYLVWKMQDVILQKKLNPYIKWTDKKEFDKENNHFDYPRKPFMFLNSQTLGRHIYDDTTPVTQGISLQDGINLMQRVITDTARDQGILVGAQEFIDRDELYKYTGAPDEKLSVKGGDASRALFRVPPKQLATFVQENLLHLENAMDNVMGTHATTRGEKSKQPTLGQDVLSKESDYGRIDGIVRNVERIATEVYNWEIQMMLVKYKEDHFTRVLGKKAGKDLYNKIKEANKKGIKITVKPGSTLPTDKLSQRQEAIDLVKAGKISDLDFFERMDFPNPKEMAKRLYMQQHNPELLYPDLIKEIEAQTKKQAKEQGRLTNGQITPEVSVPSVPAGNIPPMVTPPPVSAPMAQPPPVAPTEPPQIGTEHTEQLLQGIDVPPFEGIAPSPEHVSAELQFMGGAQFDTLDPIVKALYAKHVMGERQQLGVAGVATV